MGLTALLWVSFEQDEQRSLGGWESCIEIGWMSHARADGTLCPGLINRSGTSPRIHQPWTALSSGSSPPKWLLIFDRVTPPFLPTDFSGSSFSAAWYRLHRILLWFQILDRDGKALSHLCTSLLSDLQMNDSYGPKAWLPPKIDPYIHLLQKCSFDAIWACSWSPVPAHSKADHLPRLNACDHSCLAESTFNHPWTCVFFSLQSKH